MFLLIDKGANAIHRPYCERYVLFSDFRDCLAEAVDRGYGDGSLFPVPINPPTPGVLTSYTHGDIDVSFMTIEAR